MCVLALKFFLRYYPSGCVPAPARQVRNWGRDPAPWLGGGAVLYQQHGEPEREAKQEVGVFHAPLGGSPVVMTL